MQATVATQVTIAASSDYVFEYLANLKYHYLWNPQVFSISTHQPVRLGSKFRTESRVFGVTITATNIVTKCLPPSELVIENKLGNVKYEAHFRLDAKADKTVVNLSTTISTDLAIFTRLTVPILKKLALRELRTDLQALKVAVENHLE